MKSDMKGVAPLDAPLKIKDVVLRESVLCGPLSMMAYILNRYNTASGPWPDALPADLVAKSEHGSYKWVDTPGKPGYVSPEFTEGPATKAYMEEQDRKYLQKIAVSDPDRFLDEMSERRLLSPAKQAEKLGLDLSLPHHQNLQREFAADVARIQAERGIRATGGGATASPVSSGGASASASAAATVDAGELSRLREEMEKMRLAADEREARYRDEMRRAEEARSAEVLAAEEARRSQALAVEEVRRAHAASEAEAVRLREEMARLREVAEPRALAPLVEVRASQLAYEKDSAGNLKKLGEGHFGEVLLGTYSGATVAIKHLKVSTLSATERAQFRSEATVHANMRHPNIVMLLAVCLEEGHFSLVLEYLTGGWLYRLLHSDVVLSWDRRIDMAKQLVAGVMYLHGLKDHIIHRDLKSENVLVVRPYDDRTRVELKIGDFGLAKIKDAASTSSKVGVAGTIVWAPPEAFDDEPALTKKSDIYSLGVVFWELASRRVPYAGLGMTTLIRKISLGQTNPIPEETPAEFAAIIQDCWKLEPDERPTARDLMPRIDALAAGFFGGGAGGGEASAAGAVYGPRTSH